MAFSTSKAQLPPPPPQWVLDLASEPSPKPKTSSIPDPPGYISASAPSGKRNKDPKQQPIARKPPTLEETSLLKLKKAWELAIAPAKQLPMNAFGMWMTGNSLQIFSIFMMFQLFKGPLVSIMGIQSTFSRLESEQTKSQMLMVKAVYVLCNMLALALGVYKVNKMGLLPTTRSDWLAWETQRMPLETTYPDYEHWI